MDGFIVIDKPAGLTSHDVVARVRRTLRQKKAGHTGTLDPFATGVLPVAVGEGTKAIPYLDESTKVYRATLMLGAATDTQDHTGQVVHAGDWQHLESQTVRDVISSFTGKLSQLPPMFSALKRDGVPLYKLARTGREVEREPREIEIFSLVIDAIDLPLVTFTLSCSRGTYVRTLAHDMGERLGCGAHLTELRRLSSGLFDLDRAISLERLSALAEAGSLADVLMSPSEALGHLQALPLTAQGAERVRRGITPGCEDVEHGAGTGVPAGTRLRLQRDGIVVAVAVALTGLWANDTKNLRLLRVFN
ncbi:pseudouridine synthase [Geobacter anodireducens]|nr:pseudouridine synthase [Geobacter anodireducens]